MAFVQVDHLTKVFRGRRSAVYAVNDVSFSIEQGESLALIGESGSGKSTIARLVLRLLDADSGSVVVGGVDVHALSGKALRAAHARMAIVFQEPYESLNPRMRVGDIVAEPLRIHRLSENRDHEARTVRDMLVNVGLGPEYAERFPRALSGGQQQRVGVARALITNPSFLVLDEPTSSLDLSVQAQILELLRGLQQRLGLSYLYISHDLSTVSYIADRIAVLYLGQIREIGPASQVLEHPADPYTQALLDAFMSPDPDVKRREDRRLSGEIPTPTQLPHGCFLQSRCPLRIDACDAGSIDLHAVGRGHDVRCIRSPAAGEPADVDVDHVVSRHG